MPHVSPVTSAIPIASGAGSPAWSERASGMPDNARIDPTDRSMPPDTMTNVMPTATIALIDVCSRTFSRFETVRKWGVAAQSTTESATSPANVPS